MATHSEPLLLVDGERRRAADGLAYPVLQPATGRTIAQAPDAGPDDMDAAIAAARRAFDTTGWRRDLPGRLAALRGWHDSLVEHGEAMRSLVTAEGGVPAYLTRAEQYDDAVAALGRTIDAAEEWRTATEPIGVVSVITPWTAPAQLPLEALGPALVAGNTAVLKPAADTPWVASELGRLAAEHLPAGVLNVVTTRDVDVAIRATTDPRVDLISFTGSSVVGERVRSSAAMARTPALVRTGAPRVHVVLPGDDLEAEVRRAAHEVCVHAGQRCDVASQLQVPRGRYDEAVRVAVDEMEALGVGDPADPGTVCGPVISRVHQARVLRYLALAESEGGRFGTGGVTTAPGGSDGELAGGTWVRPTVVTGLGSRARVAQEEILGPVLVVVPHDVEATP